MLLKQDILERQVMALQQLVRDLATVNREQHIPLKKTTFDAKQMPTIMEEDEDHTEEDEQPIERKKKTNIDVKEEDLAITKKKKSKPLKCLMKKLRAFVKRLNWSPSFDKKKKTKIL